MERTIKVTGKGKISVKPDMIRLRIEFSEVYKEYETTLKESSDGAEQIKKILERLGFDKSDLKTISFNIDTDYKSVSEGNSWKRVFNGYRYTHIMKFEFEDDKKILGKILYELAHYGKHPEISIEYFISDVEGTKNNLLKNAVSDSIKKAEILAKTAGVSLGEIISIDYSLIDSDFVTSRVNNLGARCMSMEENTMSYDIDIEPENIEKADEVTVVWKIN